MKNILLINPNSPDPPPLYFGPPYGLALIAAYLEKSGRTPVCLDFGKETEAEMLDKIKNAISKIKPKYVGISCQSSNRGYIYKIVEIIKHQDQEIIIILGGPFASQKYELLLRYLPVDYIILGDGEITFSELIDCLESRHRPEDVEGLVFLRNNRVVKTAKRKRVADLDDHPFPAFHLFDVEKRLRDNYDYILTEAGRRKVKELRGKRCFSAFNALMLLSSIGCIYGCSFCPMSGISEGKYREHSPRYFVDMVEFFSKKYNQKFFVFGDNFFTKNLKRTMEICQEIIQRKLGIEWVCMTRTDYVDAELLRLMKKAGCIEISFGVETCSEKVQKRIGKNLSIASITNAFKLCENTRLRSILMLMVGNQGESRETIYETLRVVRELEPDEVIIHTTKIYPGTKIHDLAEAAGSIDDDYYLSDEPMPPPFTLENSRDELRQLKDMIKLRDVRMAIGGKCNLNCMHCQYPKSMSAKPLAEIKKELLSIAKRTDTVTFPCPEPAMRKDLMEIIKYANSLNLRKIRLETNGRIFSYNNFATDILKLGVEKIIVNFFSHRKDVYESVVQAGNSFHQAIDGIKNILRIRPEAAAVKIKIFKYNYEDLSDMVSFLLGLQVKEFYFEYEPNAKAKTPSLEKLQPNLTRAIFILKKSGASFHVVGVPYCRLKDCEDAVDEIHHPFDEMLDMNGDLVNIGKERRKRKIKKRYCKTCTYYNLCEGIWKKA